MLNSKNLRYKLVTIINSLNPNNFIALLKFYLNSFIFNRLQVTDTVHNISTIDIISYSNTTFKTGFTGTVNLLLPYYDNDTFKKKK